MINLVAPCVCNFKGLAELMASIDVPVRPVIIDNWNTNIGVSASWNYGLRVGLREGSEFTVIINDDVILEPGTLTTLVEGLSDEVLLTSITNVLPGDPVTDFSGGPDFSCFAVRTKQFLKTVGTFDENFTPAYFEDNDMHRRINLSGHKSLKMPEARAWHKGSVTQNFYKDAPLVTGPMFLMNRTYYFQKWGGLVNEERYEHPYDDERLTYKHWIANYKSDVVVPMVREYSAEGFGYSLE